MPISERINNWVEDRRQVWGEALGNFFLNTIARGATKTLEDLEPATIDTIRESIKKVIDNPMTPPEMKRFLGKSIKEGNILDIILGWSLTVIGAIPAVFGLGQPIGNQLNQVQEFAVRSQILDFAAAITAWRRDPVKYGKYLEDMKYGGWSDERIEALKFITEFLPSPRDLVEWQAKEVFEPAMISKYGLDDEFGTLDLSLFAKVGVNEEQARNFWIAHWEHASWTQVVEMLRRGQLKEEDLWDWFRLVEIPPFWRQKLINISWEVPTRVDVRRWWDMRTIDETRLREIYTALGYHDKDLEDYVLWTKVYVDFPNLIARYKNGWITLDQVREELIDMGMSGARADAMIEEKIKKEAPERVAKERDLTAAEIIKGIKKNVITESEGAELLQDMGYSAEEAWFKIAIELTVLAGSPESYAEFKDLTEKYRKASGLEGKPMNDKIKRTSQEVIRLTTERDAIQRSIEQERRQLVSEEILPAEATARLTQLQASLRQVEGELSRVKAEYERLVAEFRHTI